LRLHLADDLQKVGDRGVVFGQPELARVAPCGVNALDFGHGTAHMRCDVFETGQKGRFPRLVIAQHLKRELVEGRAAHAARQSVVETDLDQACLEHPCRFSRKAQGHDVIGRYATLDRFGDAQRERGGLGRAGIGHGNDVARAVGLDCTLLGGRLKTDWIKTRFGLHAVWVAMRLEVSSRRANASSSIGLENR